MFVQKILLVVLPFIFFSCEASNNTKKETTKPKNIILFIGDGMGPSYIKAYRMFKDDPSTLKVETTIFDEMFVGILTTDPAVPYGAVTDSAASATAMATGVKSYNGAISVDVEGKALLTVLEAAKHKGLSTGLVATSTISHATPAAFASHEKSRKHEKEIVEQYIGRLYQGMPYIDVLLGGGEAYFVRNKRNIANEFKALGYNVVNERKTLLHNDKAKLLGLFSEKGLDKMIDRDTSTPSLAEMTQAAIKQLSKNDEGFFLMVEGSQIDWAGHAQDIVGVMSEMQDLDAAISVAKTFVDDNKNTQIIVTADHSTGGLSVGSEVDGKKHYEWNAKVIKDIKYTPQKIIKKALVSHDLIGEFSSATGLELTGKEEESLKSLDFEHYIKNISKRDEDNYLDSLKFYAGLCRIISDRSYTGWTTHGHTGVDVNLYAYGPASEQLRGHWENTKIAKIIFEWLER